MLRRRVFVVLYSGNTITDTNEVKNYNHDLDTNNIYKSTKTLLYKNSSYICPTHNNKCHLLTILH